MKDSFLVRVRKYCNARKISVHAFEQANGFSNSWANNLKAQIRLDAVEAIVRNFPELNVAWLLTGIGEMLNSPSSAHLQQLIKAKDEVIESQRITINGYKEIIKTLSEKGKS